MATWYERPLAAVALAAYTVGRLRAGLAEQASPYDLDLPVATIGVLCEDAIPGHHCKLQVFGRLANGDWDWTPDDLIYVGANGVLTQTAPPGVQRPVATAMTRTEIWIDPRTMLAGATVDPPNLERLPAGEALGGHRCVRALNGRAYYASSDDPDTADQVLGITIGAVAMNSTASVQTAGTLVEPSWNWQPGAVFLGLQGLLMQTAPRSGAVLRVATAVAADTISISLKQLIRKSP